jgi:Fe-Mn family superoxide dismutase
MAPSLTLKKEPAPRSAQTGWKHRLPRLQYAYDALEPYIDERTMAVHHGELHASYVAQLNTALAPFADLQSRSALWLLRNLDSLPGAIRGTVRASAGAHVNHSLFWNALSPKGGGLPVGALGEAIARGFGSFEDFRTRFEAVGAALSGAGWLWLVKNRSGLAILTTDAHDYPLADGAFPLLLNDLWDHAYYLKHEKRRADYLKSWWPVVNWPEAARRYQHAVHSPVTTFPRYPWTPQRS